VLIYSVLPEEENLPEQGLLFFPMAKMALMVMVGVLL